MKNFRNHLMESNREKYYQEQHQEWKDTPHQNSPIAVGWSKQANVPLELLDAMGEF